jgi:release factor glutamine methyltransferase
LLVECLFLPAMKFKDLAHQFKANLTRQYSESEAEALFYMVISHFCQLKRVEYVFQKETIVPIEQLTECKHALTQLEAGKPIQYILGETYFYNLPFIVNENVLIPRPETEELVEWMITNEHNRSEKFEVLDIGTGCIAISLKHYLPFATVSAIDISSATLATAKENARLNQTDINFIQQDILDYKKNTNGIKYDVIVSNPPYIRNLEKMEMHENVLANEPHGALFVDDEDPLIFYRAIADFARTKLVENGALYFEINEYLGAETLALLQDKGFNAIILKKDMQGKDRMIYCKK